MNPPNYSTRPLVASGVVRVGEGGVRIVLGLDFIKYYQWLISKFHFNTIRIQSPKHGSHITILNNKIHKFAEESVKKFNGVRVTFFFYPEEMIRSRLNFFIPVKCDRIEEEIKSAAGVVDDKNFWGLHLTVANFKFHKND